MPWAPELFSADALARVWEDERRRRLALVPFYAGIMTGDLSALIDSFSGEPEMHHPVRGRIRGVVPFERFALRTRTWLTEHAVRIEEVDFLLAPERGVEQVILHMDAAGGPIALPVAIVSDHDDRGRILEQRVYFSSVPLRGEHAVRPPLLQADTRLHPSEVSDDYERALAAGDVDAAVAAFAPDGSLSEATGGDAHRGADALRALHARWFSAGGGIRREFCTLTDDGRACALEYNLVAWGPAEPPPQAGIVVHVRGGDGRLAAVRIYDDVAPPVDVTSASSESWSSRQAGQPARWARMPGMRASASTPPASRST